MDYRSKSSSEKMDMTKNGQKNEDAPEVLVLPVSSQHGSGSYQGNAGPTVRAKISALN
jgi:hypothetical protein